MRSGFCSRDQDHLTHDRCRLDGCSCPKHDADVLAKAAALTERPDIAQCSMCGSTNKTESANGLPCAGPWHGPTFFDRFIQDGMLTNMVERAVWLSEQISEAATALPEAEQSLRILHRLREATRTLAQVDAALVTHLYLAGEHGDVTVEGLPPVKVVRRKDRKNWDSRGAVFDYLRTRVAQADGEYPDPTAVAEWVLELVGVSYCRTTALKAAGLQPQDYCTETPGSLSVTFVE